MSQHQAALYLRSSKDRSDLSIDAQRRELKATALERGIRIVQEYADVVESGKDEDRAGFQAMLADLRGKQRAWDTILMLDTSRLSRRRHISIIFEEVEAKKHGVRVLYKSVPETDPITDMLLKSILQAMDEWHSLTSKRKGLAGMAENVRKGWRAGGRAPFGYRLQHVETGAVREGEAVTKSRLVVDDNARKIRGYLKGRAAGLSRTLLREQIGLDLRETTLIGIEWNALTYSGATVWNVTAERIGGRYKGGTKRRPRAEWVIQPGTHEALITSQEAEAILARLDLSSNSRSRRTPATYLLGGILTAPDGTPWHGDGGGKYYRNGNRKVPVQDIDQATLAKIVTDFRSESFVARLTASVRNRGYGQEQAEIAAVRAQITGVDSLIEKFLGLVSEMSEPRAILRKVEALERDRAKLEKDLARSEREMREAQIVADVSDRRIRVMLDDMVTEIENFEREPLKDFLRSHLARVTLCPQSLTLRLNYEIPLFRGDKLASPGRIQLNPLLKTMTWKKVA